MDRRGKPQGDQQDPSDMTLFGNPTEELYGSMGEGKQLVSACMHVYVCVSNWEQPSRCVWSGEGDGTTMTEDLEACKSLMASLLAAAFLTVEGCVGGGGFNLHSAGSGAWLTWPLLPLAGLAGSSSCFPPTRGSGGEAPLSFTGLPARE